MMHRLPLILTIAATLAATVACKRTHGSDATAQFCDTVYAPERASGFLILGASGRGSVIVESRNPWQGADSVCTRLLVLRGGETAPSGFDGQVLDAGKADRIVAMSSTHVALIDVLGRTDALTGVSGRGFINTPLPAAAVDVGFDNSIDYEALAGASPDLVLLYGVGAPSSMEGKLKELGIPYMYVGDYLEESPTGKAEWLVALGEILGAREDAETQFREITARYDSLCRLTASVEHKPKVMLNTPYADAWFMPPAGNYMVRLITDAGGAYVLPELGGNSSTAIDKEQAYMLASEADFWLNTGQSTDVAELLDQCPHFADTPPVREGHVYNNNLRLTPGGGNDFYESAVAHPDLVLSDLIGILHPELHNAPFVYYRHIE